MNNKGLLLTSTIAATTQLRVWLAQRELPPGGRLPPERELADMLGVSRGDLRKALADLEKKGEVWRHVGKGTFTGNKPDQDISPIAAIAEELSPVEVMNARLLIEPLLCGQAAIHARGSDLEKLDQCLVDQRKASTWRQYEHADNQLHRTIAEASSNTVLLALFDQLNSIRRAVVWGRMRNQSTLPPQDHHSFNQHEEIVASIRDRDHDKAANTMQKHLEDVRDKLLRSA